MVKYGLIFVALTRKLIKDIYISVLVEESDFFSFKKSQ